LRCDAVTQFQEASLPPKKQSVLGGTCIYDWQNKPAGKLVCQTHGKTHIVTRVRGHDYDTLIEMHRQKILTGEALLDARAIMDSEAWTLAV